MRKQNGFTLIELLIVITIIGILTVLGARKFGSAIDRANATADFSNAQTISNAIRQALAMNPNNSIIATNNAISNNMVITGSTGTLNIEPYLSNLPAGKLGTGWTVDINSSTQAVIVRLEGIQLSPRQADSEYQDSNDAQAFRYNVGL